MWECMASDFCFCLWPSAGESRGRTAKGLLFTASVLLAMITAGSNFVTALQGLLCLLTILLVSVVVERRRTGLWLLPSTLVYIIGFGLNVAAPGNSVRAAVMWAGVTDAGVHRQIIFGSRETHSGIYRTGGSDGDVIVGTYDLAGSEKHGLPFSLSGDRTRLVFCLYATGYTPSLYSLGHAGLSRTLNAVKITYFMLLFLNEIYWCGWLKQILEKRTDKSAQKLSARNGAAVWWYYVIIGVMCLIMFKVSPNQAGHYSSYGAYYYVHTGEAYNFHQEYLERVAILSGPEKDVQLPAYQFRPWFLCMGEISEDADNEANRSLAMWYHKDSVTLKEKD